MWKPFAFFLLLSIEFVTPFQQLTAVPNTWKKISSSSSRRVVELGSLPKLIVFDLDNTLWTPELYQLRKLQKENQTPKAGKHVRLMEGSQQILKEYVPKLQEQGVQFGVASRTKSVEWAHALLGQFGLTEIMTHVEIFPGSKRRHFERIKRASGLEFHEMLFFDDARDGKYGNCEPVAEMGVLSVHCPNGLTSVEVFTTGLDRFREWDRAPNRIVENDGTLTDIMKVNNDERMTGVVKMVNDFKRYGFIRYRDGTAKDLFFHFRNLADDSVTLQEGDQVSFVVQKDHKNGKNMAGDVMLESPMDDNQIQMRCFSMNMPFAALLANGYKTLETRNGTMFTQYAEGTQMLLHVGRRTYPDGDKHLEIMKSGGLSDEEIEKLKSTPPGFGRGNAIAIVELGKTYETTTAERSDPKIQRNVAAYGKDSGKMVTEIKRVAYLKRPVKMSGQGGVFKVQIDPDVIPDGWKVPATNAEEHELYASISG